MMKMFDSLTHPTLSGKWLHGSYDAGIDTLLSDMKSAGFYKAMAVGLPGVEGYNHADFMKMCSGHQSLIPVAAVGFSNDNVMGELEEIKSIGYRAIKIHPRLVGMDPSDARLGKLFAAAYSMDLRVLYCTYMHCRVSKYPHTDPFYSLVKALSYAPDCKVMLMHGGDVQVMKYAELVRHNTNLLLDLSMTFMKYEGSSVDEDLTFLFSSFDRRICLGTDHPEWSHLQLRTRFEEVVAKTGIPEEKQKNIAYENLERFIGTDS
jgi:predicted TIM-barrel fold metal-dependent hydrolase